MNDSRPAQSPETASVADFSPEWRDYFLRMLSRSPRFGGPRHFLHSDILRTMKRIIPATAQVLEIGVGRGATLAGLPNPVRRGIDALPEAVEHARTLDPSMTITLADALTYQSSEQYDAIICDRICHTIPDVQRLLENVTAQLAPGGRIFLTCFNFLWSVPISVATRLGVMEP